MEATGRASGTAPRRGLPLLPSEARLRRAPRTQNLRRRVLGEGRMPAVAADSSGDARRPELGAVLAEGSPPTSGQTLTGFTTAVNRSVQEAPVPMPVSREAPCKDPIQRPFS